MIDKMKYVLKHAHSGEYVECLVDGDRHFRVCRKIENAAKFSTLPGLIRFVAGHSKNIEDFTIVGASQEGWRECTPFRHPNDC